jgi:hypothetical protein
MAIGIIVASECKYEAMQWLVRSMDGDEEICSACLWMFTWQFDSYLAKFKSKFNEIPQNKEMALMQKHEEWCNAAMKNSHAAVSTKKGFDYGVWFGFIANENKVSKSCWIIIGSLQMLLIKKPYRSSHTTSVM